jgi:hypothetical protein
LHASEKRSPAKFSVCRQVAGEQLLLDSQQRPLPIAQAVPE